MLTRKPRLQLKKFAINGAKRLLQHNRHFCDMPVTLADVRSSGWTGQHLLGLSLTGFDVVDGARSRHRSAIE